MIKTPDPKSLYCSVVGCHKHAVGMLDIHEKETNCHFVVPICDPHTSKPNRSKKQPRRKLKKCLQ